MGQDHGKEEMDAENTSRQESDRMMEEEGMMSTDNAGGQVEQMGNKEHLWQQGSEPAWQQNEGPAWQQVEKPGWQEDEGAAESNQQQEQMLEEKQSMQEENLPVEQSVQEESVQENKQEHDEEGGNSPQQEFDLLGDMAATIATD